MFHHCRQFFLSIKIVHWAEVVTVDHDTVLCCAAEEAAVESGFIHLEQELVVVLLVYGHKVAPGFLAEEESVETHLAGNDDIIPQRRDKL